MTDKVDTIQNQFKNHVNYFHYFKPMLIGSASRPLETDERSLQPTSEVVNST